MKERCENEFLNPSPLDDQLITGNVSNQRDLFSGLYCESIREIEKHFCTLLGKFWPNGCCYCHDVIGVPQ